MKIYTRTGDSGETSLLGGTRVSKADPRVCAYGDVDELNACLGVICSQPDIKPEVVELLTRVQRDLFAIGARLADPGGRRGNRSDKTLLTEADIQRLEEWIDRYEVELPALRRFILPGGSPGGALFHLARTVCRRAERRTVALARDESVDPVAVRYLNRLSDLLFVLARIENRRAGRQDVEWAGLAKDAG
jgi:cob(I)alamin adenosyltransferase